MKNRTSDNRGLLVVAGTIAVAGLVAAVSLSAVGTGVPQAAEGSERAASIQDDFQRLAWTLASQSGETGIDQHIGSVKTILDVQYKYRDATGANLAAQEHHERSLEMAEGIVSVIEASAPRLDQVPMLLDAIYLMEEEPPKADDSAPPLYETLLQLAGASGHPISSEDLLSLSDLQAVNPWMLAHLENVVWGFLHLYEAGIEVQAETSDSLVEARHAQHALAQTIVEMHAEWLARGSPVWAASAPIQVPPLLSLELTGTSDVYPSAPDFLISIDLAGNDEYYNNAGGNNINGGACPAPIPINAPAAMLLDLDGGDTYGDSTNPRGCGATGAGTWGIGFLYDGAGTDFYYGGDFGSNGGAGGGAGTGLIIDVGGGDTYTGEGRYTNAGGGVILDVGGFDTYVVDGDFGNGGGGVIVDLLGDDDYVVLGGITTNGAGGFLFDAVGNDEYSAPGRTNTNGGGVGFLMDLEGMDKYVGETFANGGAVGVLIDLLGDDDYSAGTGSNNGGCGLLYDAAGDDEYIAGDFGTNGGCGFQVGGLVDLGGSDDYLAGASGTNGGATGFSIGFLLDVGGVDTYEAIDPTSSGASGTGVNGGVTGVAVGLLMDVLGTGDEYTEDSAGAGNPTSTATDSTVVPKGILGAQVDLP